MSRRNRTALMVLVCLSVAGARAAGIASNYSHDAVKHPGCKDHDDCAGANDRANLAARMQVHTAGHKNLVGLDCSAGRVSLATSHMQIPFIANEGQEHKDVRLYARTFWGTVFVTDTGRIVYSLPAAPEMSLGHGVALSEQVLGRTLQRVEGMMPATAAISYFLGDNPAAWRSGITTYYRVDLGEVYEGIQLQLEAHGSNVEKLFIVGPGARPADIRMQLDGVERLTIGETGELEAHTRAGLVTFTRPVAYQEDIRGAKNIEVSYWIHGNEYGFSVGDYDREIPLIIDPLLASTFLGGSGHDGAARGASVALDADGNVYVVSTTTSLDFPTTDGAYDEEHSGAGQADVCISKLDSDLTTLLASTFLGGSSDELSDRFNYIVVNGDGDVYVAGRTESPDFPTIPGAFDTTYHGDGDVYVSKLSSDLSNLLASTLIGGPEKDEAGSLSVDGIGNVYVAGYTRSATFPITPSAYQPTHHGNGPWVYGGDNFIAQFTSDLGTLSASTFLGGSDLEDHGIVVPGADGRIYVAGSTCSNEFPTTPDAFDTTRPGTASIFVSSFSSDLSVLHASTFVGGNGLNVPLGMTLDNSSNVYVTGLTTSTDFPTTPGAYSQTYTGIGGHEIGNDVYAIKLNDQLTTLLAGTYLGGTGYEAGWRVALDSVGNVYLAGVTTSLDLPTTLTSFQSMFRGGATWYDAGVGGDGWVAKLSNDFSTLLASTYLGTSGCDYLSALALGTEGGVYVAGGTESASFPTTPGAFDESYNGGSTNPFGGDLFISKLDPLLSADCNMNGIRDACDLDCGPSGGACDVPGCGGSYDNNDDGWPDECCPIVRAPTPEAHVTAKNRYLSFVPSDTEEPTALRVRRVDLEPVARTPQSVELWVGEPMLVSELSGNTDATAPVFTAAPLVCDPVFRTWTPEVTVHVFSEAIAPGAVYEVQAIRDVCDVTQAADYSMPLTVPAGAWGDVIGVYNGCTTMPNGYDDCWTAPDGDADFDDITAVVDKFRNLPGAPMKSRVDIAPETPDQVLDFVDIPWVVDAFRGLPYPWTTSANPCP